MEKEFFVTIDMAMIRKIDQINKYKLIKDKITVKKNNGNVIVFQREQQTE